MKKSLLATVFLSSIFITSLQSLIIENQSSKALAQLLSMTDIVHDGSWHDIREKTQKAWLRPAGKERWELSDIWTDKKTIFLPLFEQLGMTQAITTQHKHYTYVLLLGGAYQRIKYQLHYLQEEFVRGVHWNHTVILTSDRVLATHEKQELVEDFGSEAQNLHTEADMMRFVYERTQKPAEIDKKPLTFVDAQGKEGARPTREDTIKAWLEMNPSPGNCLAVSSQPFITQQETALRKLLPSGFSLKTIGPKAPINTPVAVYLDTIARWLYEATR